MKNPLKMNPVEKRLLLGGIANGLIYWTDEFAKSIPGYPAELNQKIDPHLPDYGQIASSAGPPLALMLVKRFKKNVKIADIAFGSMLYGIPKLVAKTGVNTAYVEGLKARPAARFPVATMPTRYALTPNQNQNIITVAPSGGKYRITS